MIDINPRHLEMVQEILREHLPSGVTVWVFGSRVSWTTKDSSDLDLALEGDSPLNYDTIVSLEVAFEESDLPYKVDVIDLNRVSDSFRQIVDAQKTRFPMRQHLNSTIDSHNRVIRSNDTLVEMGSNLNLTDGEKMYIRNKWQLTNLGNCLIVNDDLYSPKEAWSFVNYLDTKNIYENQINKIQMIKVGYDVLPSRARRKVKLGDIVYSMVRPNQKHFGIIKKNLENFLVSTGFAVLRGRSNVADTDFVYWFLTQDHIIKYLHSIAEDSTTAYPAIRPSDLETIRLLLPSLPEQRTIAFILQTLDDKIELNRRMNQTLEEMARALFKSWFVDFDPVRAKMEGRWKLAESLPGLPAHLYDLFPEKLVESEFGEVPEGWNVKTLGELCHKPQYGYTESAKLTPVGPKFLRIMDINKHPWIDWPSVPYCAISSKDFDKYCLHKGDILIARMADPGHGVMIEDNSLEAVFASYLIRFQPILESHSRLLQYWLRSDNYWKLVRSASTGTTRVSLNAKVMSKFPLITPPDRTSNLFSEIINIIRQRVLVCTKESSRIIAIRDTLLPKLISGELHITGSAV